MIEDNENTPSVYRSWPFLLAAALTILLRLPFVPIPFLNPDEAQLMGYGAYIAQTGAVYGDGFSDMRGPGAYYVHALLTILLGVGRMEALHLFAIAYQLLILVMLAGFARRVVGHRAAALGSLFFSVFSFAYLLHDMVPLNVSALTVPLLIGGSWATLETIEARGQTRRVVGWCFLAGLLSGLVFGIKQVIAIALAVYAFVLLVAWVRSGDGLTRLFVPYLSLTVGFLVGFGIMFGPSVLAGQGEDAFYWGLLYGFEHYGGTLSSRIYFFVARSALIVTGQPLIWACGLGWLIFVAGPMMRRSGSGLSTGRILCLSMLLAQQVAAFIAGHAGGHYFVPALAFMSPLAAEFVGRITQRGSEAASPPATAPSSWPRTGALVAVLIVAGFVTPTLNYLVFPEGVRLPVYSVAELFREKFSPDSPYNQAAAYVRENTGKEDTIFQLGGYDIYALTERVPAINPATFGLYAGARPDERLRAYYLARLADLRRERPKIIVLPAQSIGGINPYGTQFSEVGELLNSLYEAPIRFAWEGRSKFRNGKRWMEGELGPEWVDVYTLSH